jgi:hypothetical protein
MRDPPEMEEELGTDAMPLLDVATGGSGETDAGRSQALRASVMKGVSNMIDLNEDNLRMDRRYGRMGVW